LSAHLFGVGVLELLEDDQRPPPGGSCHLGVVGRELGVSEVDERLGCVVRLAELLVQGECRLVVRRRFPVVAEVTVGEPDGTSGRQPRRATRAAHRRR
jgi:hypothetical protein